MGARHFVKYLVFIYYSDMHIYKHNINIHIMVINSIICRANLAYNVTLYTNIAKEKGGWSYIIKSHVRLATAFLLFSI